MSKTLAWMSDPDERSKKIVFLVKAGVSRKVIRAITGWSNNQMAGKAARAGISFDKFKTIATALMKEPLLNVGFSEKAVVRVLSEAGEPEKIEKVSPKASKASHAPLGRTSKKDKPREKGREKIVAKKQPVSDAVPQPVQDPVTLPQPEKKTGDHVTLAKITGTEESARPTDDEVNAQFRQDIAEEVEKQVKAARPVLATEKAEVVIVPVRKAAHEKTEGGCQYELSVVRSLKESNTCGAQIAYAKCCHKHAMLLYPSYRGTHSKRA